MFIIFFFFFYYPKAFNCTADLRLSFRMGKNKAACGDPTIIIFCYHYLLHAHVDASLRTVMEHSLEKKY